MVDKILAIRAFFIGPAMEIFNKSDDLSKRRFLEQFNLDYLYPRYLHFAEKNCAPPADVNTVVEQLMIIYETYYQNKTENLTIQTGVGYY